MNRLLHLLTPQELRFQQWKFVLTTRTCLVSDMRNNNQERIKTYQESWTESHGEVDYLALTIICWWVSLSILIPSLNPPTLSYVDKISWASAWISLASPVDFCVGLKFRSRIHVKEILSPEHFWIQPILWSKLW